MPLKRKPKKVKTVKTSASKLKLLTKKLDTVVSRYIRTKHSIDGQCECISCGKWLPINECHCAHFIERGKMSTRWLEDNLRPACPGCNTYRKEFHMRMYTLRLISENGLDFVEKLVILGNKIKKWKDYELEELIDLYSKKLKCLGK